MSRYPNGSHRDPLLIQHDRHAALNSLHDAKLAAWAFAIGEHSPNDPPGARKPHRGMLADVLPPEPPGRDARPALVDRLARALARLVRALRPSAADAMSADAVATVGEGAEITYIDRTSAARAAAQQAGVEQPVRSRAA